MNSSEPDDVIRIVQEVISSTFGIERARITLDAHLRDDLELDSISAVELIYEIEGKFGVEVPDVAMARVARVRDIVDFLRQSAKPRP